MTAADWAGSADPLALFRHLRGRPRLTPSRWFRWAVGLPTPLPEAKLRQLLQAACDLPPAWVGDPDSLTYNLRAAARGHLDGSEPAVAALSALLFAVGRLGPEFAAAAVYDQLLLVLLADDRDNPPLAAAVRCLFGDPFHPVADPARWRTATAVHLATAVATDNDFSRLPVLADALDDAGCDHPQLLAHLRGGGPHQPGCHALDVVLAR